MHLDSYESENMAGIVVELTWLDHSDLTENFEHNTRVTSDLSK